MADCLEHLIRVAIGQGLRQVLRDHPIIIEKFRGSNGLVLAIARMQAQQQPANSDLDGQPGYSTPNAGEPG